MGISSVLRGITKKTSDRSCRRGAIFQMDASTSGTRYSDSEQGDVSISIEADGRNIRPLLVFCKGTDGVMHSSIRVQEGGETPYAFHFFPFVFMPCLLRARSPSSLKAGGVCQNQSAIRDDVSRRYGKSPQRVGRDES